MRVPLPAAMITMSSAMLFSLQMPNLRRWIIAALCSLLALASGCSALRIGYGSAPDLADWWLDRSIDFSANAVHVSSASLGDKNPGVNASVQFTIGYSWWK